MCLSLSCTSFPFLAFMAFCTTTPTPIVRVVNLQIAWPYVGYYEKKIVKVPLCKGICLQEYTDTADTVWHLTFLTCFCSQEKSNQFFFPSYTYMKVNWKFHKGDQVWLNLRLFCRTKPFYKEQLPLYFSELFLSFHENNLAIRTKIYPVQLCTFHLMVNNITIVWMLFVEQSLIRPPY